MKTHIVVLDGMRGIAALAVGMLHAYQLFFIQTEVPIKAYLAVDFFFCLSGFVIAFAYQDRLSADMSFQAFSAKRFIRLYPMLLVRLLIGGVSTIIGAHNSIYENAVIIAAGFVLFPGGLLFGLEAFPTNTPVWSLFFELAANAVYGLFFNATIAMYFVFLAVSGLLIAIIAYNYHGVDGIGMLNLTSFVLGTVRIAFPFISGVLIYRTAVYKNVSIPALVPIVLLMCMLFMPNFVGGAVDAAIVIVIIPLIVSLGAGATLRRGRDVLAAIGRVSYPFYIIHNPFIRMTKNAPFLKSIASSQPLLSAALALSIAAIASYLFVRWFDEPIRKKLGKWYAVKGQSKQIQIPSTNRFV